MFVTRNDYVPVFVIIIHEPYLYLSGLLLSINIDMHVKWNVTSVTVMFNNSALPMKPENTIKIAHTTCCDFMFPFSHSILYTEELYLL